MLVVGRFRGRVHTHTPSIAPRGLQHRAALLIRARLCAFLQVGFYVYLLQLPARLPLVAPPAIVQRVANGVIRDGLAIVGCQLVLPITVRIRIQDGIMRHPLRPRGVAVIRLGEYVPAAVAVAQPRGAVAVG